MVYLFFFKKLNNDFALKAQAKVIIDRDLPFIFEYHNISRWLEAAFLQQQSCFFGYFALTGHYMADTDEKCQNEYFSHDRVRMRIQLIDYYA